MQSDCTEHFSTCITSRKCFKSLEEQFITANISTIHFWGIGQTIILWKSNRLDMFSQSFKKTPTKHRQAKSHKAPIWDSIHKKNRGNGLCSVGLPITECICHSTSCTATGTKLYWIRFGLLCEGFDKTTAYDLKFWTTSKLKQNWYLTWTKQPQHKWKPQSLGIKLFFQYTVAVV